jgi:hypothetical protein
MYGSQPIWAWPLVRRLRLCVESVRGAHEDAAVFCTLEPGAFAFRGLGLLDLAVTMQQCLVECRGVGHGVKLAGQLAKLVIGLKWGFGQGPLYCIEPCPQ